MNGTRGLVSDLVPDTQWPVAKPFWEATLEHKLRFPRCSGCGRFQWYPRVRCPGCLSAEYVWEEVAPEGRVFSYTIVRRPFLDGSKEKLPFAVVLVQFDAAPGVTLITNLADDGRIDALSVGARTTITFEEVAPGVVMPYAVLV